jgi:hypothetical protein
MPLEEAIVDAGAVRFRPMALTAAAVITGSAVILFDPIFQGMALSLMAGEVASLLLSRAAVPIFSYLLKRRDGAVISVLPERSPAVTVQIQQTMVRPRGSEELVEPFDHAE